MPSTLKAKQPESTATRQRLKVYIGDWHGAGSKLNGDDHD